MTALPRSAKRHAFTLLLLVALGCNELFGIDPGRPGGGGGDGAASPNEAGSDGNTSGTGAVGTSATGGGGATAGAIGQSGGGGVGGTGGAGDAGQAGAEPDCTSREECRQQGHEPPSLCLGGKCVDAKSDDCSLLIGAGELYMEEEPVLFGAFARFDPLLVGNNAFYWNLVLAVREFNERGGIPIGGRNRRVLLVLCHDSNDGSTAAMVRSLDHLIERLGISGILMATPTGDLAYAAIRTFGRGQDVFMLHHGEASRGLLYLDDDGRVWSMLTSLTEIAPAYVPLVERIEGLVNRGAFAAAMPPTRLVMTVSEGDPFNSEMADLLEGVLRINGSPVAEQGIEGNYRRIDERGTPSEEAAGIAAFEPNIVVNLMYGSATLLPLIEEEMRKRGAPPPFYVLSPLASHSPTLEAAVQANSDLRSRIVGINFAGAIDQTLYYQYLARLRQLAPRVPHLEGTENYYDAAYFLLVSAAAASQELPLDGRKLAGGMRRLIEGERYDIGRGTKIDLIFDQLTSDHEATLSLYGTLGAPDFDPRTGVRAGDGSVWCFDQDASFVYDALRYNRATRELEEHFPCFDQ